MVLIRGNVTFSACALFEEACWETPQWHSFQNKTQSAGTLMLYILHKDLCLSQINRGCIQIGSSHLNPKHPYWWLKTHSLIPSLFHFVLPPFLFYFKDNDVMKSCRMRFFKDIFRLFLFLKRKEITNKSHPSDFSQYISHFSGSF